jgi:hypothetical protein
MRSALLAGSGILVAALLGCGRESSAPPRDRADSAPPVLGAVPVIVQPTVVGFWLRGSDTLPPAEARAARDEFLLLADSVSRYLGDTDIQFARVESDTVVIQLAGGVQRIIMLTGLDYPYGFVLIDPGYAEEFHTGLDLLEDLEAAIVDYFGLDDNRAVKPRHRIAMASPRNSLP